MATTVSLLNKPWRQMTLEELQEWEEEEGRKERRKEGKKAKEKVGSQLDVYLLFPGVPPLLH